MNTIKMKTIDSNFNPNPNLTLTLTLILILTLILSLFLILFLTLTLALSLTLTLSFNYNLIDKISFYRISCNLILKNLLKLSYIRFQKRKFYSKRKFSKIYKIEL